MNMETLTFSFCDSSSKLRLGIPLNASRLIHSLRGDQHPIIRDHLHSAGRAALEFNDPTVSKCKYRTSGLHSSLSGPVRSWSPSWGKLLRCEDVASTRRCFDGALSPTLCPGRFDRTFPIHLKKWKNLKIEFFYLLIRERRNWFALHVSSVKETRTTRRAWLVPRVSWPSMWSATSTEPTRMVTWRVQGRPVIRAYAAAALYVKL